MTRALVVALALACATPATALDAPDIEIAKRHYQRGLAAYDAHDYARALAEFKDARAARPAPELTYNVARCLDRLEQRERATEEYQAFLLADPYATSAGEVRERIAILARRAGAPGVEVPTSATAPPPRRRYAAVIGVGVSALVVAAVGGGLLGGASRLYADEKHGCAPACTVQGSATFLRLTGASYASFAVAGAAALVDVGLLIAAARRRR